MLIVPAGCEIRGMGVGWGSVEVTTTVPVKTGVTCGNRGAEGVSVLVGVAEGVGVKLGVLDGAGVGVAVGVFVQVGDGVNVGVDVSETTTDGVGVA
jgi:hypothetical protein